MSSSSSGRGGARQRFLAARERDRSRSPDRHAASASSSSTSASTDFRRHTSNLHLSNKISAKELRELSQSATEAGASGVSDFIAAGKRGELPGNIQRDIMRKLLKDCTAPEPYYAEIPTHDPRTNRNGVMVMMPFLLVHEMLAGLISGSREKLASLCAHTPQVQQLIDNFCSSRGAESAGVVGIGFHGDGVPHQKNGLCKSVLGI